MMDIISCIRMLFPSAVSTWYANLRWISRGTWKFAFSASRGLELEDNTTINHNITPQLEIKPFYSKIFTFCILRITTYLQQ